jgi:hypothetical protein
MTDARSENDASTDNSGDEADDGSENIWLVCYQAQLHRTHSN